MSRKSGSKAKIADFLRKHVGQVVTSKQLLKASGGAVQYSRRLRELRAEGWKILSNRDSIDLQPDQYLLSETPPVSHYQFSRPISKRIRAEVLERNGYTCQMCGVAAGELNEQGRRAKLQMGHIKDKSMGGQDEVSNLKALCTSCNEGAKNVTMMPPTRVWLLSQVRRATMDDQKATLDWLTKKFEKRR